jgi:hypothetical protein
MSNPTIALAQYLDAITTDPRSRPEIRDLAEFVVRTPSDAECITYLEQVMAQSSERSRLYEIAWDLWMLLKDVHVA